ncbi:MAG: dihydrodipicolinate synthase family protein [Rubripirellula sp.]
MIYPSATVACFDPTHGHLPRRELDHERLQKFLQKLCSAGAESVLIAASTGQGHLRTVEELREFFDVAANVAPPTLQRMGLLRPEDGVEINVKLLPLLKQLDYAVAFLRPGSNLDPACSDHDIVEQLQPLVKLASELQLPVGLYSISDVSGVPLTAQVVQRLVDGPGGDAIVAVKVTEASYENSTLTFLEAAGLEHLRIVQGWDPHLARALQDGARAGNQRCGITSGPMSLAIYQYQHILDAAARQDWPEVQLAQQAVTKMFESMQDDPRYFADLQRAKYIMGLGHPICGQVSSEQVGRVMQALHQLPRRGDRDRLCQSLDLLGNGPCHATLQEMLQS